jgi:branched-subunit amino acid transport protein
MTAPGLDATSVVLIGLGMGVVTLVTRGFFLWPEREFPLPAWLRRGLTVVPLAAMAAIIVPEVLLVQGRWPDSVLDPRWPAVAAATACYLWRPGSLGPLLAGLAVYLPLKLVWGW